MTDKQLTPMQELITALTENGLILINQTLIDGALRKEKQVIEDGFNQGYRDGFSDAQSVTENDKDISEFDDAQDYYNNKFKKD